MIDKDIIAAELEGLSPDEVAVKLGLEPGALSPITDPETGDVVGFLFPEPGSPPAERTADFGVG